MALVAREIHSEERSPIVSEKLLIVGWDGATWDYVDPLLAQGDLPNLAALLGRGVRATLRSTIPPYTNIAWPSMVTGLSPAQTGIYDAVRTSPGSYDRIPTNLNGFRGAPIWNWANRFGRRAGVLNVPMTYPASPLEGYMISGFDSPNSASDIAYPESILDKWSELGHAYKALNQERTLMDHQNPHQQRMALKEFAARWVQLTVEQGDFVAWLWKAQPVDMMFVVFSGTDSINHRTQDFESIRQVYKAADSALGRMLDAIDDDTFICLVSDHGSTPARSYMSLNRLLHDTGWLHFRPELSERSWRRLPAPLNRAILPLWRKLPDTVRRALSWPLLRIDGRLAASPENTDWTKTEVYAHSGLGPLYINVEGREPEGCVPPGDYEMLREAVIRELSETRTPDGHKLFEHVWRTEEIHTRAKAEDHPPDLILVPADWRNHMIIGYPSDPVLRAIPSATEYGTHTPDGVFVLAGPVIRTGRQLETVKIVDVMPTLLTAWGLPVPEEADGRVVSEAFTTPATTQHAPSGEQQPQPAAVEGTDDILDRLRALGYLE